MNIHYLGHLTEAVRRIEATASLLPAHQTPTPQSQPLKAASMSDLQLISRAEDEGWRRLTGNVSRDLQPVTQERMMEIAYWLWETNPLAKWLIEIAVAFIVAEGLPYEAENDKVKKCLDDFWFDPINRMDLTFVSHVREQLIFGRLCLTAFVAPQTGRVRLGYIDPALIDEVITDPENVKAVIGVTTKSFAGWNGAQVEPKRYKTILRKDAEYILSKSALAIREQLTDGICFYFPINHVTNSPGGRSELLTPADWLDAYEQFLFDYADRWPLMNTFVWDLTVQGGDDAAIKEQLKNFTKKSGSVYGHNEKVTAEAKAPDIKAVEATAGARMLRNHILGSLGYPEHWFGGGGDVNRATAVEMDTPTYKMLAAKQRNVKYMLESIFEFVIEAKRAARALRVTDEEAGDFSVITPELASKDIAKNSTAVQQVTSSLAQAVMADLLDIETARKVLATVMGSLGVEVDPAAIAEAIAEAKKTEGYEDYLKRPPRPMATPPEPGGEPGEEEGATQ